MDRRRLEELFRREWPVILGALARGTGDGQLAEDANQDAFAAAAAVWPRQGLPGMRPTRPAGWG